MHLTVQLASKTINRKFLLETDPLGKTKNFAKPIPSKLSVQPCKIFAEALTALKVEPLKTSSS